MSYDRLDHPADPLPEQTDLLRGLAWIAIAGCLIFSLSILIADFVVPDHDWMADTISDLGAGEYEFIVDIGIYCYAFGLIACAVGAAHSHLGERGWTFGIYALILTGLVVFLVGARNEYGDADQDGTVIHIYLVYALGVLFAVIPWAMADGAGRIDRRLKWVCRVTAVLWVVMAPIFFFLPDGIDGAYERVLGVITFVFVTAIALSMIGRARALDAKGHDSAGTDGGY